jgi:SAM-dependent methyltransferase
MSPRVNLTSLSSFNENHSLYHQVRPSFNSELVPKFFNDLGLNSNERKSILELAVGTGLFTQEIITEGLDKKHDLLFVEPSEGMLKSFRENFPQFESKLGSSYDLPLPDNSVDVVIIAQAFHWFSDLESVKELNRVLKKDGKIGLIWNFDTIDNNENINTGALKWDIDPNEIDETTTWREVAHLAQSYDSGVPQYRKGQWRNVFESPAGKKYFDASKTIDEVSHRIVPFENEKVYGYWLSRSYITSLPDESKLVLKGKIEKLLSEAPAKDFVDPTHVKQLLGTHYFIAPVNK